MLTQLKRAFIDFCVQHEILMWGDFVLKSGRSSPYFFNAGRITTGAALQQLGGFYASYIHDHDMHFDCLVGPAYKGILLAASTAMAMAAAGRDVPFVYNRKEKKDHGEGGMWVGEPRGHCCVVDDVITSGATVTEVMTLLQPLSAATPRDWLIMLDRQEKIDGVYARDWVQKTYGLSVHALITLDDLIDYWQGVDESSGIGHRLQAYRDGAHN